MLNKKAVSVIFTTASSAAEARKLATALVKERLAACVTVLPKATSYYRWKGKLESQHEQLLMIKTSTRRVPSIIKRIKALHSYEVPEVLALQVAGGSPVYLKWLQASVGQGAA